MGLRIRIREEQVVAAAAKGPMGKLYVQWQLTGLCFR